MDSLFLFLFSLLLSSFHTNSVAASLFPERALPTRSGYLVSTDQPSLRPNPFSWNRLFGLLFIDNPLGCGFSTVPSSIPRDQPPSPATSLQPSTPSSPPPITLPPSAPAPSSSPAPAMPVNTSPPPATPLAPRSPDALPYFQPHCHGWNQQSNLPSLALPSFPATISTSPHLIVISICSSSDPCPRSLLNMLRA